MTEHTTDTGNGRQAAHERLATGGLARWARFCASRPWRVLLGWLAIVIVLIGLVATVGGSLRDEGAPDGGTPPAGRMTDGR